MCIGFVLCWLGGLDVDFVGERFCFGKYIGVLRDDGILCLLLLWLMIMGICIASMDDGVYV